MTRGADSRVYIIQKIQPDWWVPCGSSVGPLVRTSVRHRPEVYASFLTQPVHEKIGYGYYEGNRFSESDTSAFWD